MRAEREIDVYEKCGPQNANYKYSIVLFDLSEV